MSCVNDFEPPNVISEKTVWFQVGNFLTMSRLSVGVCTTTLSEHETAGVPSTLGQGSLSGSLDRWKMMGRQVFPCYDFDCSGLLLGWLRCVIRWVLPDGSTSPSRYLPMEWRFRYTCYPIILFDPIPGIRSNIIEIYEISSFHHRSP